MYVVVSTSIAVWGFIAQSATRGYFCFAAYRVSVFKLKKYECITFVFPFFGSVRVPEK